MPSNLPTVSFVISQETLNAVRQYKKENGFGSQSKAFISLIKKGLEKAEDETKCATSQKGVALGERIRKRRVQLGLSQAEVAKAVGVTESAVSNYENGVSTPRMEYMHAIMIVLQCDANYLWQDTVDANGGSPMNVLYRERALLEKYRALDEHGKEVVDYIIGNEQLRMIQLAEVSKHRMEAANEITTAIIMIPRSIQPASAGTGMFLGPDNFEPIKVLDHPILRKTAFAVPVTGNSMEPEYHEGDTLLVESAPDISVGEIGVFTMGGQGYVKKRGENELISLNPEYEPIPLDESVRCNGRVIGILNPDWIVE